MKAFVTGAAGFIGSTLVDRLLAAGNTVIGFDNFSTGRRSFLAEAILSERFSLIVGDINSQEHLAESMAGCDIVFHLAANADVRFGLQHPKRDLEVNTIGTFNVLEAMRQCGIKKIVFSSTGSVYGETAIVPTPEDAPFPVQTSLYGASKVAGEALIQAYAAGFDFRAWIFRFAGVLGERYTHGHVVDFCRQLLADASALNVLGNGTQKKSYIYVQDCIDAIFCAIESGDTGVNIFNLGVDNFCTVRDCVGWIIDELAVSPTIAFGTEDRGWIGDNPVIFLETKKIRALGWSSSLSIEEAIKLTARYVKNNREVVFGSHDNKSEICERKA
ncbi:MAG: nucleoside-diphosphate sugar epimerase [Cyanobacteria bacterium DS3.002]|nr:nucleoside-diphosphate sugar epimerase [Cyanobacteria bacterium DS3.002]MBA4049761.1 nucleoside-diphosphate sugar epimerase [Cyanobacteria bacterium DS2.008]MBA4078399.1 nucleoside-diphosphate sugar epimerase [Cyanobacteria bacterium PR.023]